ncbi:hypothetical protein CH63R_01454 [Colletotrichum higginsianum IMI 349063]|uniref:Uncharacterized protein n=1 Tax=Colletotrichum higginsianum (strain IMI 349063) TaxID=759273 RepID=A0A1B7YWE6_COLHI|nr:hypothetical protein CH63R_01454 [Colletotrichum higginsianum IMI 349063]OBR16274.1 hypothetical protein CH63R_01454 [Colletotrichum higginsianum IMI 349063]
MSPVVENSVCLDIAIDHRIRRLFKPVFQPHTEPSKHVSRIEAEGRSLELPIAEIEVTAKLAGPPVMGGIAVLLQQPRHNHPFEQGLDAVIADCETLRALDDIFSVVSCGTMDISKNIAVIDLVPYVTKSLADVDDTRLKNAFHTSVETILDKRPDVLLCAGRLDMPHGRARKVKGSAYMLEHIAIGNKFGDDSKHPEIARIRPEGQKQKHELVKFRKVNGFHPSHAVNYHSHFSPLRQLQILIGAEVCGVYRNDWAEEPWMNDIREHCSRYGLERATLSTKSRTRESPGLNKARGKMYTPEYQKLYSEALLEIKRLAHPLISSEETYETLLASGLGEKCNDASLALRQMLRLKNIGWEGSSMTWKNEEALKTATADTYRFAVETKRFLPKPTQAAQDFDDVNPLEEIFRKNLDRISECITAVRPRVYALDLGGAANAFLQLAVDIETMLLELLEQQEEDLIIEGLLQALTSKIDKMSLAQVIEAVPQSQEVSSP